MRLLLWYSEQPPVAQFIDESPFGFLRGDVESLVKGAARRVHPQDSIEGYEKVADGIDDILGEAARDRGRSDEGLGLKEFDLGPLKLAPSRSEGDSGILSIGPPEAQATKGMVPELAATKEISLAFGMPYARYFLSDAWEIPRQPGRVRMDGVATMQGTTGVEGHWMSGELPAKTRVLVVDDNPDIVWTCSTLFRLSGFDVETALDGRAALVTARAFRPEVALLDIGLPGMDGFELARRLCAEYGPALLLIAITG